MTVFAGRYALIDRVGEGATGVVWLAHDEKLERDVAIKVLRPLVASDSEQRRRFAREARTLAQLSSDYIIRVFDFLDDGEQAFLVMEYVEGGNLAEATRRRLPLRVDGAAAYAAPVAQALAHAHKKGVVHRDLTPANVLIESRSGRVVTTDFGLARIARSSSTLTATGALIGTPEYWSPEQAMGRESDPATDVYALGCILFLLLTGRLPFEGDDRLAAGLRRAHENAPSLQERLRDPPADVVALVDSLLARDRVDRPSAECAALALEELAGDSRVRGFEKTAALGADPATTVVLAAEQSTVLATTVPISPSGALFETRSSGWRRRGGLAMALVASAAMSGGLLLLVDKLREPTLRAPVLVALRESTARVRIRQLLPHTPVEVARAYSIRVAAGQVIRQAPQPGAHVTPEAGIRLLVSKGTPFAHVPLVAAGALPDDARALLVHTGFTVRYRYTPSWRIRKGTVIDLQPKAGTRLRRPTSVKILIASGYPRAVVPNVQTADLAAAQAHLVAKHLQYRVVYRVQHGVPTDRVIGQIPAAGATVYRGTRVRLTVTRTLRWVKILAQTGVDHYESDPFTVPARWRIRYRLDAGPFGVAVAQFSWAHDGAFFRDGGFVSTTAHELQTHAVSDGAGTYRLAVDPYAGSGWYVEVDALG